MYYLMQDEWSNVHDDSIIANSYFVLVKVWFFLPQIWGKNKKMNEDCKNLAREAKIAAEAIYMDAL